MKLLLDQGLPRSTVEHLAGMGIAAEHVGDLGLATAADADILDVARRSQAVVVTLDADFHTLLATSHAAGPSVVRIRIEGLKSPLPLRLSWRASRAWSTSAASGRTEAPTDGDGLMWRKDYRHSVRQRDVSEGLSHMFSECPSPTYSSRSA
jgi:predicted nuclease of predicted toxin-antitoxin system